MQVILDVCRVKLALVRWMEENVCSVCRDLRLVREDHVNLVLLVKEIQRPLWVNALHVLRDGVLSKEEFARNVLWVKTRILEVSVATVLLDSVPRWVVSVCLVQRVNPPFLEVFAK